MTVPVPVPATLTLLMRALAFWHAMLMTSLAWREGTVETWYPESSVGTDLKKCSMWGTPCLHSFS